MKEVVHPEDLQSVIVANILVDSGMAYNIEYRIVVDNKIKRIAEKSSPIFDEKGELIRNSGICRDITLRKNNEELLRKKNRDIMNGITYARNIQKALEVPIETIEKSFKEGFIFHDKQNPSLRKPLSGSDAVDEYATASSSMRNG